MNLSAAETRVLGCLLEKQRTTPDAYPLSLNALRLACNQSTNRDPVVDYDDATSSATRCTGWSAAASRAWRAAGQPRAEVPPPARRGAADGRAMSRR